MFKSHFYSMVIFAFIACILISLIKHNEIKAIVRYALKLFLYLVGSVILFSWVMRLI